MVECYHACKIMFIQIKDLFIWHTYDSTHKQYPIFELYQEKRPLYGTITFEKYYEMT